jgi:hypothetical protein
MSSGSPLSSSLSRVTATSQSPARIQDADSTEHRFVRVFDLSVSGYRDWTFPAFGLIFVMLGAILVIRPELISSTQHSYPRFIPYGLLFLALLWTAGTFASTYPEYLRHKRLVQTNQCRIVEGPVEDFIPMPVGGHAVESFIVSGANFSYSDFIVTDGFNNTAAYGGPINGNSYVRICYDPHRNVILQLDVRDFEGARKNYDGLRSFFPIPRLGKPLAR